MLQGPGRGGRVSWSKTRNIIAYDRLGANGDFYDVWTINPDASNDACLTCGIAALGTKNKGNPDWHPSGNFLVIQVQKQGGEGPVADEIGRPGVGVRNDIWIIDVRSRAAVRVTDVDASGLNAGGVLHPHFNNRGDRLVWAERIRGTPLPTGTWAIRIADIDPTSGRASNVRTIETGAGLQFYETHGFSRDDTKLLFTGNRSPGLGASDDNYDIYSYDLVSNRLTNLTNSPLDWDEHAQISPSRDKIIWGSSREAPQRGRHLSTDFWVMNLDGSEKVRMTYWNDSRVPDRLQLRNQAAAADSDWGPNGTQLVAYIIEQSDTLGGIGQIVILDIEPANVALSAASYSRPPLGRGALISIFGQNFAPQLAAASSLPLPTNLAGIQVFVQDLGATSPPVAAPIVLVSPGQINVIAPEEVRSGPAVVTVRAADGTETRATVLLEDVAPALFTANASGAGVAAAYAQYSGSQDLEFIYDCPSGAGSCRAKEIDVNGANDAYLVLYGTGFKRQTSIQASIGTQQLQVMYAGPHSTFPGLDQINVRLPRSLAGSKLTTLNLTVNGMPANPVQIAIR